MLSMTWPEYLCAVCRINGHLRRLSNLEADVLLALLLSHPEVGGKTVDLIDAVWPGSAGGPDYADDIIGHMIRKLRRHGAQIEATPIRGDGFRIPRHARATRERPRLAA